MEHSRLFWFLVSVNQNLLLIIIVFEVEPDFIYKKPQPLLFDKIYNVGTKNQHCHVATVFRQ